MILPRSMQRRLNPRLYDAIQPYRVTDPKWIPWAYSKENPYGRIFHNDWLWPFKDTPRMESAYLVPLPLRIVKGQFVKRWVPWDGRYPLVPGTVVEERQTEFWDGEKVVPIRLPHVEVDFAGYGLCLLEGWIGDKWMECGRSYKRNVFGRRIHWYDGLKQDTTMGMLLDGTLTSDWLAHFPEIWLNLGDPE